MHPPTAIIKKEYVYMIEVLMDTSPTLFVARIREYEMVFVVLFSSPHDAPFLSTSLHIVHEVVV